MTKHSLITKSILISLLLPMQTTLPMATLRNFWEKVTKASAPAQKFVQKKAAQAAPYMPSTGTAALGVGAGLVTAGLVYSAIKGYNAWTARSNVVVTIPNQTTHNETISLPAPMPVMLPPVKEIPILSLAPEIQEQAVNVRSYDELLQDLNVPTTNSQESEQKLTVAQRRQLFENKPVMSTAANPSLSLIGAVKSDNLAKVQQFVQRANNYQVLLAALMQRDTDGNTPLHNAVLQRNKAMIEMLLGSIERERDISRLVYLEKNNEQQSAMELAQQLSSKESSDISDRIIYLEIMTLMSGFINKKFVPAKR